MDENVLAALKYSMVLLTWKFKTTASCTIIFKIIEAPPLRKHAHVIILQNFHGCKKDQFQMKNCDFFLFLLKTLIVGTRLNRLTRAVLTSTHNLCFRAKIRK